MSPPGDEKDVLKQDTAAAPYDTTPEEPVAEEPYDDVKSESDDVKSDFENHVARPGMARVVSRAESRFTDAESQIDPSNTKRNLWHRINPLKRNPPPIPEERAPSREYGASFLSMLYFQWVAPLMSVGYKRTLEVNDIWRVNPNRSVDVLQDKLNKSFRMRVERGDKRPLVMAIYDTLKFEFIVGGMCQLTAAVVQVISPFILRYLISFSARAYASIHSNTPAPAIGEGIGLVFALLVLQMIQSLSTNHFLYRGMLNGGQARAALMAVIFDKAMRLSGRAKAGGAAIGTPPPDIKPGSDEEKKWYRKMLRKRKIDVPEVGQKGVSGDGIGWSNGRIINLMSTDSYRVDTAFGMFHMVWTSPVAIVVTLILLLINLTYSALAGFGLLVIAMPILGRAIRSLFVRRRGINKITDQRVSLTQEILQGVRFVKYFGWETSFLERLKAIRRREIGSIQRLLAIRNAINAVSMTMPVFASMLAFITFSLTHGVLDPAPVFSSLALFNSLRMPLNFLPLVIGQVIDALSSCTRIQEFLLAEEAADDFNWDYNAKEAVRVDNGEFTWERTPTQDADTNPENALKSRKQLKDDAKAGAKAEKERKKSANNAALQMDSSSTLTELQPFKIKNLNFSIGRDELVAVIGTVGSGKSSLLAALAGDMRRTEGQVTMGASRAFCPQYAWIQNATVKENILFGTELRRDWYDKVVDACALRPDFDMLPAGDQTEIGERGITVSGGQKQRLNIARAIYFNSDIVLLDDPLSAVDAHVGRHIMDNAICGLLKGKCRILATHQLWVLNRVDRIIWMNNGHIEAIDTFDNLMSNSADFKQLMASTAVEEEQKEEEEVLEDEIEEEKKDSKKKKMQKKAAQLMQAEERATKSVSWSVWISYIRASGSIFNGPLLFLLLVMSQGSNIVTSLWLSWWTSNKWGYSQGEYIGVYAALGVSQALCLFLFSVALSYFGTTASKTMLQQSITRVLRAPMSFFDTTPLGRITNRFSKDIDTMDNNLTDSMRMYFMTLAMIVSVFILIISYFHYFAAALAPLAILFVCAAGYYRASAREIKRHESLLRSVVFAKFSEAVSGTATIRAYRLQDRFSRTIKDAIDSMDGAYFLTYANQRWLSTRLDLIGNMLVFVTGILVVTSRFSISPSIGGLVLSYILSIVQMIQFTVRQLAEVENHMNATERIHYYGTQLDEEPPLHLNQVRPSWPEHGEIVFDNVEMRYRPGLPLVLQGLNLRVKAGERIGVVGRTGAGKSSIMSTLFRLVDITGGQITIDDVDISKVGLLDLRSRLAIIPQDPTLFRGTVRSNLDPFGEHTDLELWGALRQADLVSPDASMTDKSQRVHLDGVVEEEGLNFSLGQRQLMALARALVRGSQIIVCDEATSSVDMETDQKIQKTMQAGFKGKTLLCIAHRLKTIIGYDRILVMDAGKIAELDTPGRLYEQGGIFRSMCDRSGIRREDFAEFQEVDVTEAEKEKY